MLKQTEIDFTSKDIAIEACYEATTDQWKVEALHFLKSFATNGKEFITEDVRIASEGKIPKIKEERAWGQLMRNAAKAGIIQNTGRFGLMKGKQSHSGIKTLWRGLVK